MRAVKPGDRGRHSALERGRLLRGIGLLCGASLRVLQRADRLLLLAHVENSSPAVDRPRRYATVPHARTIPISPQSWVPTPLMPLSGPVDLGCQRPRERRPGPAARR